MENKNRFVCTYKQGNGFNGYQQILVDRETGVNYLFAGNGYAGGVTVLLDAEGKPIVTEVNAK